MVYRNSFIYFCVKFIGWITFIAIFYVLRLRKKKYSKKPIDESFNEKQTAVDKSLTKNK